MTFQQVPAAAAKDSTNAGPCFATAILGDPYLACPRFAETGKESRDARRLVLLPSFSSDVEGHLYEEGHNLFLLHLTTDAQQAYEALLSKASLRGTWVIA